MVDDPTGKVVADKYRIESLIGESDAGDLYAARHEIRDTPVTLQILPQALAIDARWSKSFIDKARKASAAADPNILNITDFGTDAHGVTYAVYEPINGKTLREILDEADTLEEGRAVLLARQIATGVAAAHEKGVAHGSLEPTSVFVRTDDEGKETVKVFGLGGDPSIVGRNSDPKYLAPEQLSKIPTGDARSDIFALGAMLYEMLSGVVPFDGKTASEVLKKINAEPPPPISAFRRDLHPELEPIILTALAADPERRYQSIAAFGEDLGLAAGTEKETAAAAAGSKRNVWQTAFIVLAGVVLLGIALIYATTVRRTDPTETAQAEPGTLPVQPIGPATGAQEESLAKMPDLTPEDIAAMQAGTMDVPPGTVPGGDGYNAWASGAPPVGAPPPTGQPPAQYVPPGGQTVTVDPNGGSQFMPPEGGVILVPVPTGNSNTAAKPTPTPKNANTATPTGTPKPMVSPTPKPASSPAKPVATPKKKPGEEEEL